MNGKNSIQKSNNDLKVKHYLLVLLLLFLIFIIFLDI